MRPLQQLQIGGGLVGGGGGSRPVPPALVYLREAFRENSVGGKRRGMTWGGWLSFGIWLVLFICFYLFICISLYVFVLLLFVLLIGLVVCVMNVEMHKDTLASHTQTQCTQYLQLTGCIFIICDANKHIKRENRGDETRRKSEASGEAAREQGRAGERRGGERPRRQEVGAGRQGGGKCRRGETGSPPRDYERLIRARLMRCHVPPEVVIIRRFVYFWRRKSS